MNDNFSLPENLEPLSPWRYFLLEILYAIPIIGWIFLIIHAISDKNINQRNFARSYFCIYIVVILIFIICIATGISILSL